MPTKKVTEEDVIKKKDLRNKSTYKADELRRNAGGVGSFLRFLGVLIIIAFVLVTGVFAYILIERDSQFSQWAVENTSLNNFLRLSEDVEGESQSADESNGGIANEILGLDPNANSTSFEFSDAGQPLTVVEAVEQILPTVVSISVSVPNSRFESVSSGTGFFVSEDGLIVTNKHVIAPKCSQIDNDEVRVTALDHRQAAYDLELLTVDPLEDLAILKVIDGENNYEPVQLFDSNRLKLGTGVIAVGNVLGELQNTVTKGIVSGLDRSLNTRVEDECTGTSFAPESLIQTDAAINRGNSGGPLFESSGLLVGMNTFGAPDAQNIGLAIPASRIKSALESYELNDQIIRPRIGIFSRSITPLDRKQFTWLPVDYGELIISPDGSSAIEEGSAADKAGLKDGDIILKVDDQTVKTSNSNPTPLKRLILGYQKGDTVRMEVLKSTGVSDGGYEYESDPEVVELTLGGVSVDLDSNRVIL